MKTENVALVPWQGSSGISIPPSKNDAHSLITYAVGLSRQDRKKVINAFNSQSYDMAAQFVWRRSITRLRTTLSQLGMRFLGEMLGRNDIDKYSPSEQVLTEYDIVRLAEALGVVNATGALKLRHAFELLSHFDKPDTEELPLTDSLAVVRGCVQYILGDQNIGPALDFARIRERLLSESLKTDEPEIQKLLGSPVFFLRTTLRVLLSAIKIEVGAKLEHALGNLNVLLPEMWTSLHDQDRWSIGETYAAISSEGTPIPVAGLKRALLKVSGFDYVPENLRSNSYKRMAQAVVSAHFAFNNFYNETEPTRTLAAMGTVIPQSTLADCIQAYLCVFLGNMYGASFSAAPIAERELKKITGDRWKYYFDKLLPGDDVILEKLTGDGPARRFIKLAKQLSLGQYANIGSPSFALVDAAQKEKLPVVTLQAGSILFKLKGSKP